MTTAVKLRKEGIREGMREKAKLDALKMLEKNFSIDDISDITGLSEKEILMLKKE